MNEHIGHEYLVGQFRMLSFVPRIVVIAEIEPGPGVEPARLHATDIIRWETFTEIVALVGAHPEFVSSRSESDPDGVPDSPRVNFLRGTVGIEFENAGAICFGRII